jgi:DNA-binding response OmpR family regulator
MPYRNSREMRRRILLVDDDRDLANVIQIKLSEFDFEIITAADGTEGFWLAQCEQPNLVITDLRMPNGSGDYMVECLKGRSDTCDIPVIVITGRQNGKLRRWMRAMGVRHYLRKPVRTADLLRAVACYLPVEPREPAAAVGAAPYVSN